MAKTFKARYAEIDPERRARIVLGMGTMHRRYLDKVGGQTSMAFDASEYLSDEETIVAYLALASETDDPAVYQSAQSDAVLARRRLAEEAEENALRERRAREQKQQLLLQQQQQQQQQQSRVTWSQSNVLGRSYQSPQLATASRPLRRRPSPAAAVTIAPTSNGGVSQVRDWARQRLSKESLT